MGLDQYARTIDKDGNTVEIAYWRKHPNLQGWMENLWESKGKPGLDDANMGGNGMSDFNSIPITLNKDDLDDLEDAVRGSGMPSTVGFFFGSNSDDHYKRQDLDFIEQARDAIDNGFTVVYDSWW
jgi:hypothetical protein